MHRSILLFFVATINITLIFAAGCNQADVVSCIETPDHPPCGVASCACSEIQVQSSCYKSVCSSVPIQIKAAASACPEFAGPAGAGATTTAISTSTTQKQSSPTSPAGANTIVQSSTTGAPKTTAGTSSSAATKSVASQASAASASTAGASSSGKQRTVSVGGLLVVFMGILYGI